MSIIKVNQKESTIPQPAVERILKAIREGLPGISNVIAIEIITERKVRAEILTSTNRTTKEKDPLNKPRTDKQPPEQSIEEHPCINCETLQAFFNARKT